MLWLTFILSLAVIAGIAAFLIPIRPTPEEVIEEACLKAQHKIDAVVGRTQSLMIERASYKPFSFYELYLEHQKHRTCEKEKS